MIKKILYPIPYTLNPKSAGYTLVEVLVAISVTVLLSSILIIYNHSGESQIALFKEQAKIIGILLKAKGLAVQTYSSSGGDGAVCGYGVHFDAVNGVYLIFTDLAEPCSSSDNKYSGSNEDFEKHKIDSSLNFLSLGLVDLLFIPPDPAVIIDGNADKKGSFEIAISSKSGGSEKKIKVNNFGQISAQ